MKLQLVLALAALAAPLNAQDRRVPVVVDYVAGADVYVALGSRDGLAAGDTIVAYAGGAGAVRGAFLARVVTLRRTVLSFTGTRFETAAGDTLWLGLLRPPPAPVPEQPPAGRQVTGSAEPGSRPAGAVTRRAPELDGQLAFELDAFQTTVTAGDSRRYTTPTIRLWARAADLPGGFRVSTNLRATRRVSTFEGQRPGVAVRAYEASLEKTFAALPLRLQAGRFSIPREAYGGYWDGLLTRVGGERFGISAAAGFLPQRTDEGFTTDVPRASAIADFHARGNTVRYDVSFGLNALRPRSGYADQTWLGMTQHLRWRELSLTQALQVDREANGSWLMSAVQLAASVPLTRGLIARAAASRFRPPELDGLSALPVLQRDRGSVGLGYYSGWASLNADLTATRRADGRVTSGYSASLFVPRTLAGIGFSASASLSDSQLFRSSWLSTDLSRRIGPVHARVGLRSTRFQGLVSAERNSGAELTLNLPVAGRTQLLVRAETWWGDATGNRQRILTSLTTGF